jgi:hypothetical protein
LLFELGWLPRAVLDVKIRYTTTTCDCAQSSTVTPEIVIGPGFEIAKQWAGEFTT